MLGYAFLHFDKPVWVYVSIPIAAALVGWFTKIVAIEMMFRPIEFRGIRPFLGWQGQIPKRAPKMAAVAVDSVTKDTLKPEELFDRIDPDELARELEGPLHEAAEEIVEAIMLEFQPQVWKRLPAVAKRAVVANVEGRAPAAARNMMDQIRKNLDRVFDMKHMVVVNLTRDKPLLCRMFRQTGADAFKFLIKCGLIFGAYIGLVQVAVYGATGQDLVLPLFGLITGGLTDYLALTMIFRPVHERRIAPFIRWQGLFHNKRDQVTRDYAALLAKDILTPAAIMDSLLTGPMSDQFFRVIEEEIRRTIDEQAGFAGKIFGVVGGARYQRMKQTVADLVVEQIPERSKEVEAYAAERLDVENTMVERMSAMDSESYENLLRPAFKEDEWIVVALGATLGFLFGELQVQIITRLAG
jgi:uncharacterized membrane protein YheB (UPF0754 family)